MLILTAPEVVRGDVPGLLCRGMPLMADPRDGVPRDQPLRGVVAAINPLDVAFEDYLPIKGTPGLVTAGRALGGQGLTSDEIASHVLVDWSHPAALDCALRWLADRGHACHWMRPRVYGGCIDDHGDLPAGTVSAILVARSVLNVAAGVAPPRTIARGDDHRTVRFGPEVGQAAVDRINITALADGCALLVPGGVALAAVEPR